MQQNNAERNLGENMMYVHCNPTHKEGDPGVNSALARQNDLFNFKRSVNRSKKGSSMVFA